MRKIFLDCGSNIGQGFKSIFEENQMNEDWEFFLFEPNKQCVKILNTIFNFKKMKIFENAVSNEVSTIDFILEYCPNQKDWIGGASHILGNKYIKPDYINENFLKKSEYKVNTINLSDFLKSNFEVSDYIILKLDIEGKEFDVLNKMIEDETLRYIDKIYVEWHERFISDDMTEIKKNILENFEKNKINYKIWY